jgi:hypothetical protein
MIIIGQCYGMLAGPIGFQKLKHLKIKQIVFGKVFV